jgi:transcriptional regulator with XRE-family HTH domain
MAFKAGFARSYYSGVERGVRNISAVNLIQLAKALHVEVGDLFPQSNHL